MKKAGVLVMALFGVQLWAAAAPTDTQDYEFYKVRTGESVETIASSRGLRPDVLRSLNPALENVVFPPEGTVIFVPPRLEAPRPARTLAARSGRLRPSPESVASAAPVKATAAAPASAPRPARSGSFGLSEEEVDYIFEHVVVPRRGAVEESEPLALPSHQNVMITADGRTVAVPSAAPPRRVSKKKDSKDDDHKLAVLSPRGQKVVRLIQESFKYLGVPYVWGGEDPSGMDCSGFTQKVYCDRGMPIPRTADLQFEVGQVVPRGQEQPGDMVFFETYCPGASHVGIYMGRNQFVHASSGAGYITFGDLRDEYFSRCYLGARRNW
ncbi:MAG: C40 family peptidase [Candidatus Eremiobacteraeota bacterium]|nr:C40 family peptidase [Candidatus Eremiobacteraeota bacterium]MCW5871998.1 C40 family peptidase [Candidatus Eremiobacteraeota bacterium]